MSDPFKTETKPKDAAIKGLRTEQSQMQAANAFLSQESKRYKELEKAAAYKDLETLKQEAAIGRKRRQEEKDIFKLNVAAETLSTIEIEGGMDTGVDALGEALGDTVDTIGTIGGVLSGDGEAAEKLLDGAKSAAKALVGGAMSFGKETFLAVVRAAGRIHRSYLKQGVLSGTEIDPTNAVSPTLSMALNQAVKAGGDEKTIVKRYLASAQEQMVSKVSKQAVIMDLQEMARRNGHRLDPGALTAEQIDAHRRTLVERKALVVLSEVRKNWGDNDLIMVADRKYQAAHPELAEAKDSKDQSLSENGDKWLSAEDQAIFTQNFQNGKQGQFANQTPHANYQTDVFTMEGQSFIGRQTYDAMTQSSAYELFQVIPGQDSNALAETLALGKGVEGVRSVGQAIEASGPLDEETYQKSLFSLYQQAEPLEAEVAVEEPVVASVEIASEQMTKAVARDFEF